jgi:hypothetical protein
MFSSLDREDLAEDLAITTVEPPMAQVTILRHARALNLRQRRDHELLSLPLLMTTIPLENLQSLKAGHRVVCVVCLLPTGEVTRTQEPTFSVQCGHLLLHLATSNATA